LILFVRRLGVDYGRRRVGLAVSDPGGRLASPLEILTCRGLEDLAARLCERAAHHGATEIVLGMPYRSDGSPGTLAPEIERLAAELRARGCVVALWDESLTTWEAERRLHQRGPARGSGKRRRAPVDAAAAAVMLQSYLEAQQA
jgi:putative Holliday junction resolvase